MLEMLGSAVLTEIDIALVSQSINNLLNLKFLFNSEGKLCYSAMYL